MSNGGKRREDYASLVAKAKAKIREVFPWDLEKRDLGEIDATGGDTPLLLDIREPDEFAQAHLQGSINVPRGILEPAAEWGFVETVPELVEARERPVIVICRSGNRSALAALTMRKIGFKDVRSLKLGVRGWNDSDMPLITGDGEAVHGDTAEAILEEKIGPEKLGPGEVAT